MLRNKKTKKLETRRRNIDPLQELREMKENELRQAIGGCQESVHCPDCEPC